jgi:cytochrome c oxidase cbb3-type subunit I/II
VERYGEYSKAGEFVYDHPFLWGSKRTGPDLMRIGAKYPNSWHYQHMLEPTSMSPGSLMPSYPWLFEQTWSEASLPTKINAMSTLGVPYPADYAARSVMEANVQAKKITADLQTNGINISPDKEIIALIAYLQRMGTDIKGDSSATSSTAPNQ